MAAATYEELTARRDDLPRRSTLLGLIQLLEDRFGLNEDEVLDTVPSLVNSGRVELTGNLAGVAHPFS